MKKAPAKKRESKDPLGRYGAKLLFQFRVTVDGSPGIRRICEERIINFSATDARAALKEAKRRGRAAQHSYRNNHGNPVYFQFLGVMELLCLGVECDDDEVWYDILERVTPKERSRKFIPPESKLHAIRNNE